jgi:hypothetical protein
VDTSGLSLQQEKEEIDALAATEAASQEASTPELNVTEQAQSSVPEDTHDELPPPETETPLLLEAGEPEHGMEEPELPAAEPINDKPLDTWQEAESAAIEEPTISFHHERPRKKNRRLLHWAVGILIVLGFAALVVDILLDSALWIPNFVVPHTEILQHIKSSRG